MHYAIRAGPTFGEWAGFSEWYRLMFVFSVAAWFPGGATQSQPSNRYSRTLAEPDVVRYTIRLPA